MKNINSNFPDVIRIEPTGKCNFKCIHCPTGTDPNNRSILKIDDFDFFVNQIVSVCGVPRVVVLYHGGEPLLNKNIYHFILKLKKIGVQKIVITTNASLLTRENAQRLIESGIDEVKISLDGDSIDENDRIRVKGDFKECAKNIKVLLEESQKLNKNINVIISNVRILNKNELDSFISLKSNNIPPPRYLLKYFDNEKNMLTFRSIPTMVWPGFEKFGEMFKVKGTEKKPTYCSNLFETFTILTNGDVVVCCYDLRGEVILGNIYQDNALDIWNNSKYTKIREDFKKSIYNDFCSKCTVVSPVYLCRK